MSKHDAALEFEEALQDAPQSDVLIAASRYVSDLFGEKLKREYVYHNFKLVFDVVKDCQKIGEGAGLEASAQADAILAATFVYSGYADGHVGFFENSEKIAAAFFAWYGYKPENAQRVISCMKMAMAPAPPMDAAARVVRDAMSAIAGKKKFFRKITPLRYELEMVENRYFLDTEWDAYLLTILKNAAFLTSFAQGEFTEQKTENLSKVDPSVRKEVTEDAFGSLEGKLLERGIDTFFKTQSKIQQNLVSVADHKAHMLISTNSIVLSIALSTMPDRFDDMPYLFIPGAILVAVNLATIIFSVASVKPALIKNRKVTRDDLIHADASIVAQLMFSDVAYADFKYGVRRLMGDEAFLYETLIQGIYGNGRVLQKKFWYLAISYNIFIYGIFATAGAFGLALLLGKLHG